MSFREIAWHADIFTREMKLSFISLGHSSYVWTKRGHWQKKVSLRQMMMGCGRFKVGFGSYPKCVVYISLQEALRKPSAEWGGVRHHHLKRRVHIWYTSKETIKNKPNSTMLNETFLTHLELRTSFVLCYYILNPIFNNWSTSEWEKDHFAFHRKRLFVWRLEFHVFIKL